MRYAVVDVETTGLYPGGHDRVVELAIVRVTPELTILDEYTSLLNPGRDIGPSWLHGIETRDVLDAPEFLDIAGEVAARLEGALLVGHNVGFDYRFLESEFGRGGIAVPRLPYVDTMSMAVRMGAESRRLEEACTLFGIDFPHGHSALGDALATTALFLRCLAHFGPDHVYDWIRGSLEHLDASWPRLATRRDPWPRQQAAERRRSAELYLASLVRELPASSDVPGDWQSYYGLLDRALEDRRISEGEAAALANVAVSSGLSARDVKSANEEYLGALVRVALRDGVLSETERKDIEEVAYLLALDSQVGDLIERVSMEPAPPIESDKPEMPVEGMTVCFTGAMNASIRGERATRERATEIATAHGMLVVKSVTKKLDYLVIVDPDSLSGKAKKARKYGTRILAESVFWNLVGVDTDG